MLVRTGAASQPSARERRLSGATLGLASLIAAGVREHARDEWAAEQIAGRAGEVASSRERLRFSVGLIRAALQIRASRLAEPGVGLLDQIARSEARTCRIVAVAVVVTALYVFHAQGLTGVIADGESLLAEGGALYGAARWRRSVLKKRDEISGTKAGTGSPPDLSE